MQSLLLQYLTISPTFWRDIVNSKMGKVRVYNSWETSAEGGRF